MKRLFAVFMLAFNFSASAHPEMLLPDSPHIEGERQSTAPPQINPTSPSVVALPKQVGGDVTAPVLLKKAEAKFTDAGRKAKVNGVVLVGMTVETDGIPSHVHVVKSLGYGLDETAVAAITQFRFKPAVQDGKPVPVEVNVEVHFQVFKRHFLFY